MVRLEKTGDPSREAFRLKAEHETISWKIGPRKIKVIEIGPARNCPWE
jgi:hypothetical protein